MPIFEYKCEKCGKKFEKLVPNSETKVVCEKCGSKKVEKQLSSFAAKVSEGGGPSQASCCPTGTCCPDGICNL